MQHLSNAVAARLAPACCSMPSAGRAIPPIWKLDAALNTDHAVRLDIRRLPT
jgi:hypothetical protein